MSGLREALVELTNEWGRYGPMAPEAWQILDGIRAVLDGHPVPEGVTLTEAEREDVARAAGYAVGGYLATHDLYPAVERVLDARLSVPAVGLDVETVARIQFEASARLSAIELGLDDPVTWAELSDKDRQHLLDCAAAVVAADPRRSEAEVKAEALREAADEADANPWRGSITAIDWLRDRAARITEGGEG